MRPIFPKNKNKQFNATNNGFHHKKTNNNKENVNINKEKIKEKNNDNKKEDLKEQEIKKYQNIKNKNSIELIKNNKKREYLEENGFSTISNEETAEKENSNNNELNENNQEKEKEKKNILIPKNNNYIFPEDLNHNKNIPLIPHKPKNKPPIEQFEYLQKIKEEQKKLNSLPKKNNLDKFINDNYYSSINHINPSFHENQKIEHSFRKKNKRFFEENIKITNDKDENSSFLEDKRNHRSTREINEYLREKKIKYKQNEETKQLEKNKKLFVRFKNLYNLNMKDIGDINKQQLQINYKHNNNNEHKKLKNVNFPNNKIEERKDDFTNITNNLNIHPIPIKNDNFNIYLNSTKTNNQNNIRKKKEINEYYIGNESTIRNNNSTLVDANEYYLNILESQQLLVNSKLKKINNETETNHNINIQENNEEEETNDILDYKFRNNNTEINNMKNNLILNELCVSKEQIRKITDKEKTKSSNSKKSDEILNTYSIEELKEKINTTLKRANLFFSKEVMINYKQNILNNLTNNSDININNNLNTSNKTSNNNLNTSNKTSNNKNSDNNYYNNEESKGNESEKLENKDETEEKEKNSMDESKKINNFLNDEDMKPKSSEIKIETSNIDNRIDFEISNNKNDNKESGTENLKEQNLPSLSHNNTTNNTKIKIEIEPRAVLNLVEIIKFIFQRKIFVMLYESYIKHAISQQYNIAFSFFVAICKQYPFKKLEEYYNYKTYNYAFRQLFRPFNRKNFKYFLNCFQFKKKVEYLVALITKMIKFKTIERIYLYGQYYQEEDDEEKAFKMIISKIIYTLIKPHLYEVFNILRNNINNNTQNNENNDNENKIDKDDSEVNFNISDEDENENLSIDNYVQINIENKDKNFENENNFNSNSKLNENEKNIDLNNKECSIENSNTKENINDSIKNKIDKNDLNINKLINENNISNDSIKNHRRKNDSSLKMNSFLYESLDSEEKSSISVEPNSVDNDKLHQLKMILIAKNKNFENGIDDNYINDDNDIDFDINNSSKKSEKSLQELINIKSAKNASKTLSDMMEENSLQKSSSQNSIDNLKKTLNNPIFNNAKDIEKKKDNKINNNLKNYSNSNSSLNSIGSKDKNIKNEELKVNNDTKDTKEITEDSNTININTNNKSDNKSSDAKSNEINSENKSITNNKININEISNNENEPKKFIDEKNNEESKDNNEENKEEEDEKSLIEIENKIQKNNLKSRLLKNYKIIEKNDDENMEVMSENKDNENESDKIIKPENKKIKIPLIKIINDSNSNISDNKNSKEESKETKNQNKFSNIYDNKDEFADELVDEIMKNIIFSEIKNTKIKLLPNKKYKFEKFLKKSLNNNNSSQSQNNSLTNSCNSAGNIRDSHKSGSHNLSHLSLHEDVFSLNDSLNSNYSVYSVFNKTIKDKKKEHSLHLYFDKICPKLIAYLHKEIIKKYQRIYNNISLQKKNISENLMISLVLQDAQMLRNNYKKVNYKEQIDKIIDKKEILRNFAIINKKIRQEDNITSDNYYDNMINECVIETAIELIEKERFYGENGEPLKWSSRTREISFKFGKNDSKKFADYICKNILKIIHNRIGLINDNYSYMNQDEINYEREKRLLDTIKNDLNKNEGQWKNLEMEETQLKVESTEMILDQLYNEVIEILEHIQFNRASPELYQYKSIYACEEIPKLSFQQTTTEDMRIPEGEENEFMNI